MKLYTKTICPKCMLVKSALSSEGIEIETINLEHDAEARNKIVDAGIMAVPVLAIDGNYITDVNEIISTIIENQ